MQGKERLEDALLKVALGFQVAEVTEEFAEVDGALKLTKRKRTKKDVPPDLKAVQLLLGDNTLSLQSMSNEELEEERKRLLAVLAETQKNEKKAKEAGQVRGETAVSAVKKARPKPRKRVVRKKKEE